MSVTIILETEGAEESDLASTLKHVANLVDQGYRSGPLPGGKFDVTGTPDVCPLCSHRLDDTEQQRRYCDHCSNELDVA